MPHPLDHPLLPIWLGVISRCHSPSNPAYRHYGGRGIHVSMRWLSFPNFAKDMGPRPTPEHSVERNDVNKGYGPTNCRWATQKEQCRNTRRTTRVTFNGETRCVTEWAERLGISPITLRNRLKRGWPIELAMTAPITKDGYGKRVLQRRTIELCAKHGVTRSTFYWRLKQGWSEHDALTVPLANQKRDVHQLCAAAGISVAAFYGRLRRGWSQEQALQTPSRNHRSISPSNTPQLIE